MQEIILYAIPFFILALLGELAISAWRKAQAYETTDALASLSMGLGSMVADAGFKFFAFGLFWVAYQFRWFELDAGQAWVWVLLILGDDFCYYWYHRAGHRVRMVWAAHINHHSSTYFNLSTALRQSWTTGIFKPWFYLPLAFMGFHPILILAAQSISLIYQFWVHTEFIGRLGPLEWVMNTPSHHRVHHGANKQYVDKNYAGIFIIWDRLFGTFEPERQKVVYGLRKDFTSRNPIVIAFHEWQDMLRDIKEEPDWRNKLAYLLMPPAWRPGRPGCDRRALTWFRNDKQRA